MRLVTLCLALFAFGAVAAAARPLVQLLGPTDFSVTADWPAATSGASATIAPQCTQPSFPSPSAAGMLSSLTADFSCTIDYVDQEAGIPIHGSVTRLTDNAAGRFDALCNWTMTVHVEVDLSMSLSREIVDGHYTAFRASGPESCSWSLTFGPSALNGTISGQTSVDLAGDLLANFDGSLEAQATSGEGDYAHATGGGGFVQRQQFTLPSPTSWSSSIHAPMIRLPAAAAPTGRQQLKLALHTGASRAVFVLPGSKVLRSGKKPYRLQLAAPPRSACTATATGRGHTVKLGSASDSNHDGTVVFGASLAKALTAGTWKLSATCVAGGTRTAAAATIAVS